MAFHRWHCCPCSADPSAAQRRVLFSMLLVGNDGRRLLLQFAEPIDLHYETCRKFRLWFQRRAQSLANLSDDCPAVHVVNVDKIAHCWSLRFIKNDAARPAWALPQSNVADNSSATGDRRFWLSARALVLTNSGALAATFGYPAICAVQVRRATVSSCLKLGWGFRSADLLTARQRSIPMEPVEPLLD